MGCRLWGRTESDTTEATWQLSAGKLNSLLFLFVLCFVDESVESESIPESQAKSFREKVSVTELRCEA